MATVKTQATPNIPWPTGCPNDCFIAGLERRNNFASSFISQSEQYAIDWLSDCSSKVRASTFREAAGIYASLGGSFMSFPVKTKSMSIPNIPPDCNLDTLKSYYGQIKSDLRSIHSKLRTLKVAKTNDLCTRIKNEIDLLALRIRDNTAELVIFFNDVCPNRPCDLELSNIHRNKCRPPPEAFPLAQYWLQVAKTEISQSREIFAAAEPTACESCCSTRQAITYESYLHYVAVPLIINILIDVLSSATTKDRSEVKAEELEELCGGSVGWTSITFLLSSASGIVDSLSVAICGFSECGDSENALEFTTCIRNALDPVIRNNFRNYYRSILCS